jgi:primosomal protein N' (replication factor Y) (superfamily II helicase)
LQSFLGAWLPGLHALRREARTPGERILRWAIDIDPLSI